MLLLKCFIKIKTCVFKFKIHVNFYVPVFITKERERKAFPDLSYKLARANLCNYENSNNLKIIKSVLILKYS